MLEEPLPLPDAKESSQEFVNEHIVTYDDAVYLSGRLSNHTDYTLGVILTLIEASLGDTKQAVALKQSIKREMYAMKQRNQSEMYVTTGQQSHYSEPAEIHFEN